MSSQGHLTPIPIDEAIASLSAILLDETYYHFIHAGKLAIDGLSILSASHLIPIKARAHIDLADRKKNGENIDDRDIRKHKNDIIRLFQLLSPSNRISLPDPIHKDFQIFLEELKARPSFDCRSLGLKNMSSDKVIDILKEIYLIQTL